MDLGARQATLSMPMPFPTHYPSIPEAARIQIFTSGNGVPPPPPPLPPPPPTGEQIRGPDVKPVRYRDCQKNHAANIGGHAVDGCGEFMPSGEEGTMEALRCAACGCHRNFHRREIEGEPSCDCYQMRRDRKRAAASGPPTPASMSLPYSRDLLSNSTAQMVMALNSTPIDSDDLEASHVHLGSSLKKRFRTKFSTEQKEKMCAFADKLGWKIQKHDELAVQEFCAVTGVSRNVLKVWMHNNKHTMVKKMEDGSDLFNRDDCTTDL